MAIVFEKHISYFSLYQINSNVSRTFLMFFKKGLAEYLQKSNALTSEGRIIRHCFAKVKIRWKLARKTSKSSKQERGHDRRIVKGGRCYLLTLFIAIIHSHRVVIF